jgi:outer membrane receptor protein involved in Fe transport
MTRITDSKYVLLAGASALAMSLFGPLAVAQEEAAPEDDRRLGTVTVTTQKVEQSIQDVPIAVSAFDEESLNKLQLAGGPDLVKSIPNVSFTKGNFAGYNFKVRGIGNDAVAQSGDAGVGVHQNDVPLTANNLFEAEFFDMERIEVLRGPQGTLYGRNATGGVFNAITAKPVMEEYQGSVTGTIGNFGTMKYKGMLNVPLGDKLAVRLAGSYLERDGFMENTVTGNDIDSRKLYGIRASVAFEPTDNLRALFIYDKFEEDDSRIRSGKQLCDKDPGRTTFRNPATNTSVAIGPVDRLFTSLGCQNSPLSQSLDRVNSQATLGGGLAIFAGLLNGDAFTAPLNPNFRQIESAFDPQYEASQELYTGKIEFDVTDSLLLTYLGSYSENSVLSQEDYNKIAPTVAFNTSAGPFALAPLAYPLLFPNGTVNDPQLGSSNRFRTFDQSGGGSEQSSHEIRLQSSFDGPFNFNLGAIKVDVEAIDPAQPTDGYYVFSNSLTAIALTNNLGGANIPIDTGVGGIDAFAGSLNGTGGNYFRSISPYTLDSYAIFGEGYYDVTDSLKATVGLRYTSDKKEQDVIPSILFTPNGNLNPRGVLAAEFEEVTGRAGIDWQPDLGFTDDTLVYGFYSRGYKGGGLNPPQPAGNANAFPATFDPEFINSYELGTKNTLADGALQLNAAGFIYDYKGYQITQIVNRTSANFNIDAKLQGLEIESIWNPVSTFVLNANLGLLKSEIQDTYSIDVLNRTNGRADLVTLKNSATFSNCVVSAQGYATILGAIAGGALPAGATGGICSGSLWGLTTPFAGNRAAAEAAFGLGALSYTYTDSAGVVRTATALQPIDGDAQQLDGNAIPGAPESTLNVGAEYTWEPGSFGAWGLTGRLDYYRQAESYSRVFNSARDALDSWDNLNVSVVLFNDDTGVRIEAFGKNVSDEEVITGAYLTDDSSGLFTNIFLTEPRTYGVSITKSW